MYVLRATNYEKTALFPNISGFPCRVIFLWAVILWKR